MTAPLFPSGATTTDQAVAPEGTTPPAGSGPDARTTTPAGAKPCTIAFPPGYTPDARRTLFQCGANAGLHYMVRARITKQIRGDMKNIATLQRIPAFDVPVTILAVQHPAKGRRALDPENVAPLVKAAIDGLRDAKVLVNDSPKYVTKVSYVVGDRVPLGQLVLHITPAGGDS
jgi:crossover junction endodeoxyribonuclease RusA